MDPNAILARVLELAAISGRRRLLDDEADELAAGAKSLDEWLTSGGFWPERWAGRGVNLKLANDRGRLDEQFNRVRGLLGTKQIILPSLTPQIVTAVPFEPDDDGRVVAALATHVAFAADPATAVSRLYDMLALTLSKIGEA